MQNRVNTQSKLHRYGMGGGLKRKHGVWVDGYRGLNALNAETAITTLKCTRQCHSAMFQTTVPTAAHEWTVRNEYPVFDNATAPSKL